MKNKFFLLMVAAICFFSLGSCDKDDTVKDVESPLLGHSANLIEMTVLVPIHSSSLEFFDFVIRYSDNMGAVHKDTIRDGGGIVVGEERDNDDSELPNNHYIKTYLYYNVPVVSIVTVEMVPKVDESTMASFIFYNPKPYIYPSVYFSTSSIPHEHDFSGLVTTDSAQIDMTIGEFLSSYGSVFSSYCRISLTEDGFESFFY